MTRCIDLQNALRTVAGMLRPGQHVKIQAGDLVEFFDAERPTVMRTQDLAELLFPSFVFIDAEKQEPRFVKHSGGEWRVFMFRTHPKSAWIPIRSLVSQAELDTLRKLAIPAHEAQRFHDCIINAED